MTTERRAQRAYRKRQLPSVTGVGLTTLDGMIAGGEFPAGTPVTDDGRAKIWFEDQIAAWQESRRAKGDGVPTVPPSASTSTPAQAPVSTATSPTKSNRQKHSAA